MLRYRDLTTNNKNPIRRAMHRQRITAALSLLPGNPGSPRILDFGAGDGELCLHLARQLPQAEIWCYEPTEWLRKQAEENLRDLTHVSVIGTTLPLPDRAFDVVYCTEVFEHLPPAQSEHALQTIVRALAPGGTAIISVPVEVFLPALYKGVFRLAKRPGEFDARWINILRATLGLPIPIRPVEEIAPGLPFHSRHIGFDYRIFRERLKADFTIRKTVGGPASWLGTWAASEVYFVCGLKE